MLLLKTIETVDITKEIPLKYWIIFIIVMFFVLKIASKILTNLFIPKPGEEEAPIWSKYDEKNKYK